jgi:hypothetical protein
MLATYDTCANEALGKRKDEVLGELSATQK